MNPSTLRQALRQAQDAAQDRLRSGQALGGSEYVTVAELVQTVIAVSGKEIGIEYVEGPVGVHSRNPSTLRQAQDRLRSGQALTRPVAGRWDGRHG